MTDDPSSFGENDERSECLSRVLAHVVARRASGEDFGDDLVIAAHRELMPELGEKLRVLGLLEVAEVRLSASGDPGAPAERAVGPLAWVTPRSDAIPGYEIVGEVHRGGQGVVCKAIQQATRRDVAIKVISAWHLVRSQAWLRFQREVEILARLRHPNIVTIHDSGRLPDGAFLVMDFVEGRALDEWLAEQRSRTANAQRAHQGPSTGAALHAEVDDTLRLFVKICDAVNAAHLRGVIHRDLKPTNILVDAEGTPHVLDFGLAKVVSDDVEAEASSAAVTVTGQFVGSLPWASPEQVEGSPDSVDLRTDVYSLGVALYQALTGRFPYPITGRMRDVVGHILTAEPLRPSAIRPGLGDEVETIVLKCLQKRPERRYQSAGELARDITRFLAGDPIEAKRDSTWYVLRKTLRRHKLPVAVAVAFGAVLAVSAAALTVMYGNQGRALTQATRETRRAERTQDYLQRTLDAVSQAAQTSDVALKRALLAELTRSILPELIDQPDVEAIVRDTIGRTYQRLGLYEESEQHLRAASALRQQLYAPDSLEVAASLHNLADLVADRTRFAEAATLFRAALAIRQKRLGDEHLDTAATLYGLADALHSDGELAAAEPLLQWALALFRKLRGAEHPDVALCLTGLGLLRMNREDYRSADPYLREALAMNRRLLGDEHPDVASSEINLAKLLFVLGDYEAAEPLFRNAIATYRRLLGDEHDNVAWGLHRYGLLLQAKGEYAEAEVLLRETLATYRKVLGNDDPYVARALNSLGTLLLDEGDCGGAEPLFEEAARIWHRRLGDDDPLLAWNLNRLGELRQVEGDAAAAEPLLRTALAHRGERGHIEYDYLVRTLNSLAALLAAHGDYAEAESLLREALEFRCELLGDEHPDTADSMCRLGALLAREGQFAAAEPLLLDACDVLVRRGGISARPGAAALRAIVRLYEDWDAAEPGQNHGTRVAEWRAKLDALAQPVPSHDTNTIGER